MVSAGAVRKGSTRWPAERPNSGPASAGEGDHAEHGGGVRGASFSRSPANRPTSVQLPLHHPSGGPLPTKSWGGISVPEQLDRLGERDLELAHVRRQDGDAESRSVRHDKP